MDNLKNNITLRKKKPFSAGQKVFSMADQSLVFIVAACYFDKILKTYRFATHGGGNFDCIYFKIIDQSAY